MLKKCTCKSIEEKFDKYKDTPLVPEICES